MLDWQTHYRMRTGDTIKFGVMPKNPELVHELLNKVYEGKGPSLEVVKWLDAAPNGANRWYAAFDREAPVAVYGLLPMLLRQGDSGCSGALCNNVGVIPEYRGRGIFTDLGKYALEDMAVDYALGVPNDAVLPGHVRVGWKSIGRLQLMSGHVERRVSGLGEQYSDLPDWMQEYEPYFSIVRDQKWRRWRYSKPEQEYVISKFGNCYAVWKQFEERGVGIFSQMRIGKQQIMEASNDAVPFMVFGGADPVELWLIEGTRRWQHYASLGFKSATERELIIYPPIHLDPDDVRFDAADFDVF